MAVLHPEYALRKLMLDDADVSALVSTRIYPANSVPENAQLPYIIYEREDSDHFHTLDGNAAGVQFNSIMIDVFQTTDKLARELAEHVRDALQGYSGTVTSGADSVTLQECILTSNDDFMEPPADGGNAPIYGRAMNFNTAYNESIPAI